MADGVFGPYRDQPTSKFNSNFIINKYVNLSSNYKTSGSVGEDVNAATAIDAIDTTGVTAYGSDVTLQITVPAANGGDTTGGAGAIVIFLDADADVNPDNGANKIGIGIDGKSDGGEGGIAYLIQQAINGATNERIDYASSGRGQSGVSGITADVIPSDGTKITLSMDVLGPVGNITEVLHDPTGVNIIDEPDFTGAIYAVQVPFSTGAKGPINLRGRTTAYKVTK